MNVNSTNTYVNKASSSKGMSGLASGLDTDSMVEAMLSGTQSKIDKQNGLKQQIEWKQEIYRDIISQVNMLQKQFFSTSSSTSLLNEEFFNAMSAIANTSAFKVTATSGATVGKTQLEVRRLATNTRLTSGHGVSGKLEGVFSKEALDQMLQELPDGGADSPLTVSVTLDGIKKDLKLEWSNLVGDDGAVDLSKVEAELRRCLNKAHGEGQVRLTSSVDAAGGKLSFELEVDGGRKVMVSGEEKTLDAMGVKNGQSNRIGLGGSLKELYFTNELQGKRFRFSINDVEFTFSEEDTIGDIMTAVNRSDAGVRLVYKTQDDKFVLEASDSGAGRKIEIKQEEGNLMSALFGAGAADCAVTTGRKATSDGLTAIRIAGSPALADGDFAVAEGSLHLTVDGEDYTLAVPRKTGDQTGQKYGKEELIQELNRQLEDRFGEGKVSFTADGSMKIEPGMSVAVKTDEISDPADPELVKQQAQKGDLGLAFFGVNGADNHNPQTLAEAGINGLTLTKLAADGSVESALEITGDTLLSSLDGSQGLTYADGRITFEAEGRYRVAYGAGSTRDLFGRAGELTLGAASHGTAVLEKGQNAEIMIDGLLTERSSNSFSINGLNIDLRATTGSYAADGSFVGDTETIEVSRDTDRIVDGIKKFIDEYNKLVKTLNDYLDEKASYRKYAPLTEAQKKEMTEKEIELWEEKAKEGLLRRDPTIDTFLQAMRTAMYERPEGCSFAIYDLGIETGDWENKGQLVLSEDGEAALRQCIESDPASVLQLFTSTEDGLAVKLNQIIDETAKISSGSPGSLVELAGVKGKASETQNTLYDRLKEIDNKIAALKRTYEKEKARYWKQFNAMEQVISNMNTQSSWLTQQFSMM